MEVKGLCLPTLIDAQTPTHASFESQVKDPVTDFVERNLGQLQKELKSLDSTQRGWCKDRLTALQAQGEIPKEAFDKLFPSLSEANSSSGELVAADQSRLKEYVQWEQDLDQWAKKEQPHANSQQREEAVKRVRNCFHSHARHLDLSNLRLSDLPNLKPLDSLVDVDIRHNKLSLKLAKEQLPQSVHFSRSAEAPEPKASAKQAHAQTPREAEYALEYATESANQRKVEARKELHRAQKIANKQRPKDGMWTCADYQEQKVGGLYTFQLKEPFAEASEARKQSVEQWPAVEAHPSNLTDLYRLSSSKAEEADIMEGSFLSELGFGLILANPSDPGNAKGAKLVLPDVSHLQSRWGALREHYPELRLPLLDIAMSEGIASHLDFVEALMTHMLLVSDASEFVHDMTAHVLTVIRNETGPEATNNLKICREAYEKLEKAQVEWGSFCQEHKGLLKPPPPFPKNLSVGELLQYLEDPFPADLSPEDVKKIDKEQIESLKKRLQEIDEAKGKIRLPNESERAREHHYVSKVSSIWGKYSRIKEQIDTLPASAGQARVKLEEELSEFSPALNGALNPKSGYVEELENFIQIWQEVVKEKQDKSLEEIGPWLKRQLDEFQQDLEERSSIKDRKIQHLLAGLDQIEQVMKTASFGLDDSSKAVVEKGIAALRHDRLKEQNSQLVASSTLRNALQASTQSLKVFRWEMERAQASVSSHNQLKNALEGLERQIESLNSSGKKAPELETLSERAKSLRSAIEAFDKRDKDADALHLIQKDLQLFETTIGAYTDVGNVQPKGELQDYSTRDIRTFLDDPLWRKYFWKEVGSDASEAELAPIRTQVQRLANAWNRLEEQHSQWVKEKKLASSKARLSAQLAPFKRGLEDWCKAEPNDLSRREAQKRIIEALDAIKSSDSDANELTLDLNDIGLTEVPPNLNQLPSLYHLNLSGNQITHVPADLACAELNLSRQTSDEIRLSISEVQATALSAVDLRGCANVRFEDIDGAKAKPNNSLCRIGVDKGAHNLSDDDLKTLRSAQISVIELSA